MEKDKILDYIEKSLVVINESLKGLRDIDKTQNEMIINLAKRVEILEEER